MNAILTDPALDKDVAAIRGAVQRATPVAQDVQVNLQAALPRVRGQTRRLTESALAEVQSAMQLGQLILTGPAS